MSTTMFDAREALVRGSVYDRQMPAAPIDHPAAYDTYFHTHDRLSYIGAERTIPPAAAARIPVPVGMFIPPVPPPHHNFFGQVHSLFLAETLVTDPCILQRFFFFSKATTFLGCTSCNVDACSKIATSSLCKWKTLLVFHLQLRYSLRLTFFVLWLTFLRYTVQHDLQIFLISIPGVICAKF